MASAGRFRFSLRTLLLFVLLIATASALWWRWEPWGFSYSICRTDEIKDVNLSADGKLVLLTLHDLNPNPYKQIAYLEVLDIETGQLRNRVQASRPAASVRIDGEYVYFGWFGGEGLRPEVFNYVTGARIEYERLYPQAWGHKSPYHFCSKNYVLLEEPVRTVLARLPDLAPVRELPPGYAVLRMDDQLIEHRDGKIEIHDLNAGNVETLLNFPDPPLGVWAQRSLVQVTDKSFAKKVFDRKSGKLLFAPLRDSTSLSSDESRMIVDEHDAIRIYDLSSGKEIATLGGMKSAAERLTALLSSNPRQPFFVQNDDLIWDYANCRMYDGRTLDLLCDFKDGRVVSYQGGLLVMKKDRILWIATPDTCRQLMDLTGIRQRGVLSADHSLVFATGAKKFIAYASIFPRTPGLDSHTAHVFSRRRPWQWYAAAWLPELWITLTIAVGFIVSVGKDRRQNRA